MICSSKTVYREDGEQGYREDEEKADGCLIQVFSNY
jgi:hypothetical protein